MIHIDLQKTLKSAHGEMHLDIKITIEKGQFVTLYGDSGAGKTSTFRMIAGLLKADSGKISVNEKKWFDADSRINLPPQKRKVGFVFQDYALFPNMTVRQNLEYALHKNQDETIISQLIETAELGELQNRKPETLSGGQKQRVALARALVQKPEILLLDEPMSALDSKMRLKLQDYILKVHRDFNLTTILISHEIGEIFKLSEQVFVLENGIITSNGSPDTVFGHNTLSAKFRFTGEILNIQKEEVVYILTVLIGNNLVKIIAQQSEINAFNIGDKVLVASKAFNPVIQKI
ncbi:sulfate/molybdate ABC transporter ATP-binding protein [Leeuwenhoekiella sp. A16]|uniref:sulfate/molybdate ABC transporter ATP-binding protein n=1 Tax=unclassified Leeuwenhoekiella TaxID=2615029 RepID=UPI003A7FF2D4